MRGQPTNISLGMVLELLDQNDAKQLTREGFAALFDALYLTIEGILPKETYHLTYQLYALSRDLGDPNPLFCSTPAQIDAEIDLVTPKLEALYLSALDEPFFSLSDQDEKPKS
jgi:hypothetical protein